MKILFVINNFYIPGNGISASARRTVAALKAIGEDASMTGKTETLLAKLYNNQAEQYRLLAVEHGKVAVEETKGNSDAVSELTNAWGSYISDWNVRNHHALIAYLSDYCERNPKNRCTLMWLLDNLIDDRRLAEAKGWLQKLAALDDTFRVPMYRYLIAQAEGKGEIEQRLRELEEMKDQEWCWALTLGDIYTQRQEYDKAIAWYRKGQDMQPAPKFIDSAMSIAHICEIRGDKAGAIEAYREVLRIQREDWGIVSGEERDEVERAIRKLQ